MSLPLTEEGETCAVCGESVEGVGVDRLEAVTHDTWTCGRRAQMHSECWEGLASVDYRRTCGCGQAIDPPDGGDSSSESAGGTPVEDEAIEQVCPMCGQAVGG